MLPLACDFSELRREAFYTDNTQTPYAMGSIDSATRRVVSDEQGDDEFRVLITGFGVHEKHPPQIVL